MNKSDIDVILTANLFLMIKKFGKKEDTDLSRKYLTTLVAKVLNKRKQQKSKTITIN